MPQIPPPKRHPYDQWAPDARALDLVGDKWTLLIVRDLAAGPRRFVQLQRVLPGISTEQLRSRLNRMVADGLLTRQRYREVPPRVDYELTDRARELMPILAALARWGYDWAWSPPRATESVDVGAIFRLAAGLVSPAPGERGIVEAVVEGAESGQPVGTYGFTLGGGSLQVREHPEPDADASIRGPLEAWVAAFAPAQDRRGLQITGDSGLAHRLLDQVSPAEQGAAEADRAASA